MRKWTLILLASTIVVAAAVPVLAVTRPGNDPAGDAKGGRPQPLSTVTVSAITGTALYPGSHGDVWIRVSNPNPYPVRLTAISLHGSNADISADARHPGCTTTGVSFTSQGDLSAEVPANSGGVDGTKQLVLKRAVRMSNASVDGCQGAVFSIPVVISGIRTG